MKRVRISTTVDAEKLGQARALVRERDSALFDAALAALVEERLNHQETAALKEHPYHEDADLGLPEVELSEGELPYEGQIPKEVLALARRRRRARER